MKMNQVDEAQDTQPDRASSPSPALASCPFCGKTPWYGEFPSRASAERHEIACENERCWVRVEVYAASKIEATKRWNTRASAWRPISEAPKDGTLILLADKDYVCPGFWDRDEESEGGQCWRDRTYDMGRLTPTCWQPYPDPPSVQKPKGRIEGLG